MEKNLSGKAFNSWKNHTTLKVGILLSIIVIIISKIFHSINYYNSLDGSGWDASAGIFYLIAINVITLFFVFATVIFFYPKIFNDTRQFIAVIIGGIIMSISIEFSMGSISSLNYVIDLSITLSFGVITIILWILLTQKVKKPEGDKVKHHY